MRKIILFLSLFSAAHAMAVPPPPIQVTADCATPSYASDMLVCEDAGLRELDKSLAMRIAQRENTVAGPTGNDSDQDWFRRSRLCAFESEHRECLVTAYCLRLALIDRGDWISHTECSEPLPGSVPVSSFTHSGFVSSEGRVESLLGREIAIWGFVDQQNLFGDDDTKLILGDWWAGYGPDSAIWQFKLKAHENDHAGQSFAVQVPNDLLRDDLLRLFVRDAEAGQPTKVYLTGIISTFPAPTNARTLLGLSMELQSSRDIRLGLRHVP